MAQNLRSQVLQAYKSLRKTTQTVFQGDSHALSAARQKINEEYRKCAKVRDDAAIKELIAHSNAVRQELEKTVIQAEEIAPGNYKMRMRDEIIRLDNVPFNDCQSKN